MFYLHMQAVIYNWATRIERCDDENGHIRRVRRRMGPR